MTKVVHCRKEKFDIYIGRGSIWGNPFKLFQDGSRYEVIEKYRKWFIAQPELMAALPALKGKILGCHCKPLACHGDVLVDLIEDLEETKNEN